MLQVRDRFEEFKAASDQSLEPCTYQTSPDSGTGVCAVVTDHINRSRTRDKEIESMTPAGRLDSKKAKDHTVGKAFPFVWLDWMIVGNIHG